jgi:hypothetical protein
LAEFCPASSRTLRGCGSLQNCVRRRLRVSISDDLSATVDRDPSRAAAKTLSGFPRRYVPQHSLVAVRRAYLLRLVPRRASPPTALALFDGHPTLYRGCCGSPLASSLGDLDVAAERRQELVWSFRVSGLAARNTHVTAGESNSRGIGCSFRVLTPGVVLRLLVSQARCAVSPLHRLCGIPSPDGLGRS